MTDTERLDALQANAWELRPYVMLGGAVGWFVQAPDGFDSRLVAFEGDRDPRKALDAAIATTR